VFQLLGLLFVGGAIVLLARWLLIGAAIGGVLWLLARGVRAIVEADRRRGAELDALLARADQQHQWVMAGDDRGVYGRIPARVR
jgi:hypothetical protein